MNNKTQLTLEWSNLLGRNPSNVSSFYNQIWRNQRADGGMRLTPYGANILDQLALGRWDIKIKNTQRTGHVILNMDKFLETPYFFNNRRNILYVYNEEVAMQLMLYDGDLSAFLEAYSQFRS